MVYRTTDWGLIARAERDLVRTPEQALETLLRAGCPEDKARRWVDHAYAEHSGRTRVYGAVSALGGVIFIVLALSMFLPTRDTRSDHERNRNRSVGRPSAAQRGFNEFALGGVVLGAAMILIGGRYAILGSDKLKKQ